MRSTPSGYKFSLFLCGLLICGCGGGSDTDEPQDSDQSQQVAQLDKNSTPTGGSTDGKVRTDTDGRKWYDSVPLDVWYKSPLDKYNTPNPAPGNGPPTQPNPQTPEPAPKQPSQPEKVAITDWKTVIPKEVLESEVKRIRNKLNQSLTTVSSYNLSYLQLPADIAMLGALANIAIDHPDPVNWQANAKHIRAMAAEMVEEPLMRGAKSQKKLRNLFEPIVDILSGSPPSNLPEAEDGVDFGTTVDFGMLMKRVERSADWLKSNNGTEAAFKSNKDEILQEAIVLATIAKVIAHDDYGYADDEDYLGHSIPMLESGLKMATAVNEESFDNFDAGLSRALQSCTECHTNYRNN